MLLGKCIDCGRWDFVGIGENYKFKYKLLDSSIFYIDFIPIFQFRFFIYTFYSIYSITHLPLIYSILIESIKLGSELN